MKIYQKSFSLVEISITIVVLGVIIAGILPAINNGLSRARVSVLRANAQRLAAERAEELKLINLSDPFFATLMADLTNTSWIELCPVCAPGLDGNESYGELRLDITNPDDPFNNFRRITEGSWDLQILDPADPSFGVLDSDDFPGNLSVIRVTVFWDSNGDLLDDGQETAVTFRAMN